MSKGELVRLQGDFLHQLLHVGNNVSRLLAMQDQDSCSPSFGCFHYAYWRDKTSDFADARFQEAAAVIGLLSLDVFDDLRELNNWPPKDALYASFRAGLHNLAHQQYPEGCYDEWYKGERGFAATAFTTCAFGLAALHLGDHITPDDLDVLTRMLRQAGLWLARREDVVKINHEVVAAAALTVLWKLTGETRWREAAEHKLEVSLAHRNTEGWFSELGGADLGYSGLCIDYLMIYFWMTEDSRAKDAAERLLEFLVPHLHPDMTVAAEAGTSRNPYIGQIGFLLLQPHDRRAAAIVSELRVLGDSSARISSYLSDDLRLARWAILPVVAAILERSSESLPFTASIEALRPQGWTIHEKAALAAYHRGDIHVYVAVAGGSVLRIYRGTRLLFEDRGISIQLGGEAYSMRIYDSDRHISRTGDCIASSMRFEKMSYLFPSFFKRLVLRLGSLTPVSSRTMRALIDRYRLKNHSAVNQSASSVGSGGGRFILTRSVNIAEKSVYITDVLCDGECALNSTVLRSEMKINGIAVPIQLPTFTQIAELTIKKIIGVSVVDVTLEIEFAHV